MARKRNLLSSSTALILCCTLVSPHVLAQGAAAAPPAAAAQSPLGESLTGDARAGYESGRILYGDGDYAGAALKFRSAYEASKDYRLLWNVAACEKNLRHYAQVLRLVSDYLQQGAAQLSEQDRAEAIALRDAVQAFVSKLNISVTPADAEVYVDGKLVGKSPLTAPIQVDMGQRTIRAVKEGYEERTQTINAEGGKAVSVALALPLLPPPEGRLRVVAEPGAEIWVNGNFVGQGEWEGRLAPGTAQVRVTASGKKPYDSQVEVREGQLVTNRVSLEAEAPSTPLAAAAPQEQEGSSAWLWILGGGVLLVGAGVGAYFLLRPDEEKEESPMSGTIPPGVVQLPLSR